MVLMLQMVYDISNIANTCLRGVTKKKSNCINHAFGTMPVGKPLGHRKNNFLAMLCCNVFVINHSIFVFTSFYVA